jgi:excisionase family DNA binding protein
VIDPKVADARDRLTRAGFNVEAVTQLLPLLVTAMLPVAPAAGAANEDTPDRAKLMRYAEAARFLDMPEGTLMNRVAAGTVPHSRLGPKTVRFDRAALLAWIASRSNGGGA